MTVPTRLVTCVAKSQNGSALEGATFTFVLSRLERHSSGIVVPQYLTTPPTSSLGITSISLFPNALGLVGSQYLVKGRDSSGNIFLDSVATLPDANSTLESILSLTAYPVSLADVDVAAAGEIQYAVDLANGYAQASAASASSFSDSYAITFAQLATSLVTTQSILAANHAFN